MIWQSLKPTVWMILLAGLVLLVLAGWMAQDWAKFLIPPPENTAEQLVSALGAHRYQGALNQLSQELEQQVNEEDLWELVQAIEHSSAQGIQDAHGQSAQERGSQALAEVQVKLGNHQQVQVQLPLKKEHGVWKVSSLDPLRQLAGSNP